MAGSIETKTISASNLKLKLKFTEAELGNKTEVESVQLGNTYIADMDKCPKDKCCPDKCLGNNCNLFYMFPGPFV